MKNKKSIGHLAALLTIIIWGTTFISTKVLLVDFKPVEILFFRFIMGYAALLMICPRHLKGVERKQEVTFMAAGFGTESQRRYTCCHCCFCVGVLFHFDKENQQLRLFHYPDNTQDFFLRYSVYDTDTVFL